MQRITPQTIMTTLEKLLPPAPIIIEAGAFKGKDSCRMARQWPQATIYAFEPVLELFQELQKKTAPYKQIHCINKALGTINGNATFWPSEHPRRPGKASQAGSLLPPKERLTTSPITFGNPITIETITLDNWCQEMDVKQIDLLWLDLQGYELPVMQASPKSIERARCIWTEVHFIEAYASQAQYQEVSNWLKQQGFSLIARDFDEPPAWFFGNILALKE